jgi:hypothetical protein
VRLLRFLPVLIVLSAQPLTAAEPFRLQLTSLSEAWFPGSSVIQVPAGSSCRQLQVKLDKISSGRSRVDALELYIDGVYPRFSRLSGEDGFVLNAQTREPLGLIPKEEHRIEASVEGGSAVRTEWTIDRWQREYIEAKTVGAGGSAIDISLELPIGGVVVGGRSESKVRLRGEVRGGGIDSKLKVNGEIIRRLPAAAGYQFDQEVPVAAGAHELLLTADDQAGDQTILALPILN